MSNGLAKINCAARICCDDASADRALHSVLIEDLGLPEAYAPVVAEAMRGADVVFMPGSLAREISRLADHPGRDTTEVNPPMRNLTDRSITAALAAIPAPSVPADGKGFNGTRAWVDALGAVAYYALRMRSLYDSGEVPVPGKDSTEHLNLGRITNELRRQNSQLEESNINDGIDLE